MELIQNYLTRNFTKGRKKPIDFCVVHITEGTSESALQEFQGPTLKSSHYLIRESGIILHLVRDEDVSYHAGNRDMPTSALVRERNENPNERSIGIEVAGFSEINDKQFQALKELVKHLCEKHNIPISRRHIIGHREIYVRKDCPAKIDIDRLVEELSNTPYQELLNENNRLKKELIDYKDAMKSIFNWVAFYFKK